MFMSEDIVLSVTILRHDDLLSPKESSEVFVEVHLLLETDRVMADPEVLRVGFETYVEHAKGEDEKDSESAYDNDGAVVVVKPSYLFKDDFKVHPSIILSKYSINICT